MKTRSKPTGLTRKQVAGKAQVPFYIVDYLHRLDRLPVIHESTGPGDPVRYAPKAVQLVRDHYQRSEIDDEHAER